MSHPIQTLDYQPEAAAAAPPEVVAMVADNTRQGRDHWHDLGGAVVWAAKGLAHHAGFNDAHLIPDPENVHPDHRRRLGQAAVVVGVLVGAFKLGQHALSQRASRNGS